jgi:transcriptional regulator with XRE-family HTH domain
MKSTIKQQFGERLKLLREKSGMSQKDLAKKSEMIQAKLSQAENGDANMTLESIERLALALGVPPKELLP